MREVCASIRWADIARAGETAMRHKLREVQAFLPGAKITLFQKVRSLLRRPSGA